MAEAPTASSSAAGEGSSSAAVPPPSLLVPSQALSAAGSRSSSSSSSGSGNGNGGGGSSCRNDRAGDAATSSSGARTRRRGGSGRGKKKTADGGAGPAARDEGYRGRGTNRCGRQRRSDGGEDGGEDAKPPPRLLLRGTRTTAAGTPGGDANEIVLPGGNDASSERASAKDGGGGGGPRRRRGGRRNRNRKGGGGADAVDVEDAAAASTTTPAATDPTTKGETNKPTKAKPRRNKRKDDKTKYPWRKYIPRGTVDPISLDHLSSLRYPPFALVSTEPYAPVREWPTPEMLGRKADAADDAAGTKQDDDGKEEERHRRILEEQWGASAAAVARREESQGADDAVAAAPPVGGDDDDDDDDGIEDPQTNKQRYYHLFDGRVLAFYLVSQLQFIDPLNRRDLTRDELLALDDYLARHELRQTGVVEAYDAKGVTVNVAGVAGQTEVGRARARAETLQHEASTLLTALFSGDARHRRENDRAQRQSGPRGRRDRRSGASVEVRAAEVYAINDDDDDDAAGFRNRFERQYAAHERRGNAGGGGGRQPAHHGRGTHREGVEQPDHGIYATEGGGMLIIDDDENPGLRGGISSVQQGPSGAGAAQGSDERHAPASLYSSRHIAERHGHAARVHADSFPALPAAPATFATAAGTVQDTKPEGTVGGGANGGPSKTLRSITTLVKKTDPADVARQKKAREEAQRRAMLSKLSFVVNTTTNGGVGAIGTGDSMDAAVASAAGVHGAIRSTAADASAPSAAQLERNRALASALGVAPATVREDYSKGWARPTVGTVTLDEFGNELNAAQYPDSLIILARERMAELLKLEKRWKAFLVDDTSASHPLRPMDRPTRKFVHEYSDFWKLHTESFDPEPKRYIHCVKLRDTSAPHPLLSEAARTWRGPGSGRPAVVPTRSAANDVTLQQAAGQSTLSREFPRREEQRVPLQLEPRTVSASAPPGAMFDLAAATAAAPVPTSSAEEAQQRSSRFSSLVEGRERAKLNLAPRTIPLELPAYERPSRFDAVEETKRVEERRRAEEDRQRQMDRAKQRILADAFASSDEESAAGGVVSDSDWEEEEAVYEGSDEEGA